MERRYVGIDLHRCRSVINVMDGEGHQDQLGPHCQRTRGAPGRAAIARRGHRGGRGGDLLVVLGRRPAAGHAVAERRGPVDTSVEHVGGEVWDDPPLEHPNAVTARTTANVSVTVDGLRPSRPEPRASFGCDSSSRIAPLASRCRASVPRRRSREAGRRCSRRAFRRQLTASEERWPCRCGRCRRTSRRGAAPRMARQRGRGTLPTRRQQRRLAGCRGTRPTPSTC